MLLFLFSIITISTYHWEKFSHPPSRAEELYKELSENLREEVRYNFNTLQTIKYEMVYIKEDLYNNSLFVKNTLRSYKMKNKRKMDLLFARYAHMIKRVHQKSSGNLDVLEINRKRVSERLHDLKRDHSAMIDRLTKNKEDIEYIYENKREEHMNTMEDKYEDWKNKREEIKDIIENIN
jgi:hypothetical protein